jgi:co-chaperonin GroES (HSP10)
LFSKSVVLAVGAGGTEKRWKNLERVWVLVNDEAAFKEYVRGEIRSQLEGE